MHPAVAKYLDVAPGAKYSYFSHDGFIMLFYQRKGFNGESIFTSGINLSALMSPHKKNQHTIPKCMVHDHFVVGSYLKHIAEKNCSAGSYATSIELPCHDVSCEFRSNLPAQLLKHDLEVHAVEGKHIYWVKQSHIGALWDRLIGPGEFQFSDVLMRGAHVRGRLKVHPLLGQQDDENTYDKQQAKRKNAEYRALK